MCVVWCTCRPPKVDCHFCQQKQVFRYRFQRVDGGPDLRFNNNDVICVQCGHKHGEKPIAESVLAEQCCLRQQGYDAGLQGQESEVPAKIRPNIGQTSLSASAWYEGWYAGNQQYEWTAGFNAGLLGTPQYSGKRDVFRFAGWIEGDAKRQGLHYFPTKDATEKIKDLFSVCLS